MTPGQHLQAWQAVSRRGQGRACTRHQQQALNHLALHLQARQFEPDYGRGGPGEEWDEALGYLDACGPGVNLIARTSSELPGTRWGSLISQGSGDAEQLAGGVKQL